MIKIFWFAVAAFSCASTVASAAPDCTLKPVVPCRMIHGCSPPVSLECLIQEAKRIVVGVVVADKTVLENVRVPDTYAVMSVRTRTLQPVEVLKSNTPLLTRTQTFAFREPYQNTLGAPVGRKVLLFFGDKYKDFDSILYQYAGFFSGHDSVDGSVLMQSAGGNENLWGKKLWSSTLSREKVAEYLPANRREELVAIGDGPATNYDLPLEFLIAVIRAKVN